MNANKFGLFFERKTVAIGIGIDASGLHVNFLVKVSTFRPEAQWIPLFVAEPRAQDEAEKWINLFSVTAATAKEDTGSLQFDDAAFGSIDAAYYPSPSKDAPFSLFLMTCEGHSRRDAAWGMDLRETEIKQIFAFLEKYFAPILGK